MKIVYSYYVLDLVHRGHLKMMENAKAIAGKDGKLIVGILTDEAVMEKKPKPIVSFDERFDLANALKYVDLVVAQDTYSPLPNVKKIKPDILMESTSHTDEAIEEAREVMESIGGKVIVIPYYPPQSSSDIKNSIIEASKNNNEKNKE
ncbi:MAG: adenylyltransferase/cytidyltransferase family protein [Candidatus Marinimicrobia bacterium]|jgi:phosphoenolpyruvate phosphomutase|nr:adenylyltransferase/cytidyltransferase family protein [Candidatus Neomarinimicrobiota bacterium]